MIDVPKERDSCQIETYILGKTVRNQKQVMASSLKELKTISSGVQSEAYNIQKKKTRLLYQVNMMQKQNIDITGELSNIVANHACAEEELVKLNTLASENMNAIEDMRKKNYKDMTEKDDIDIKLNRFHWINEKTFNFFESSSF